MVRDVGALVDDKSARGLPLKAFSDDGADAERLALEARHARKITRVLRAQLREILPQGVSPDVAAHAAARLQMLGKPLQNALYAMLLEGARLGADYGKGQVSALQGTATKAADGTAGDSTPSLATTLIDWDLVNEDARLWASNYAGLLLQGINMTTLTILQGALGDYVVGSLSYTDLIAHLAPSFGSQRANLIASTEITRAFAEGNRMAWTRTGVIQQWAWVTVADERVCPTCDGLDGQVFPLDSKMPPAHPSCRCFTRPEVANG